MSSGPYNRFSSNGTTTGYSVASNPPSLPAQANTLPAPLYAQLKQMIAQQIRSGTWPAHYRVPSES